MKIHQCFYCKKSYTSEEKNKNHEKICVKNNKTFKERFKEKINLKTYKRKNY